MIPADHPRTPPTILLWLEPGAFPSEESFDLDAKRGPPHPNPDAWWFLSEALEHAMNTIAQERNAGKMPWVRSGTVFLDPDQVRQIYKTMVAQREGV